jgi:hypothetical protein
VADHQGVGTEGGVKPRSNRRQPSYFPAQN